jgi:hypothetical protein
MATINRTLFGVDSVVPLVAGIDYVYAYSPAVSSLTNSEVRILCNSTLAVPTIELPPISAFNGNYSVTIVIQDQNGTAVANNILVNPAALSGDKINSSAIGWKIDSAYGSIILTIASEGHWVAVGGSAI